MIKGKVLTLAVVGVMVYAAAEYTNQNTPGTFASAGAETPISSGHFRRIGMSGGMSNMNGGF